MKLTEEYVKKCPMGVIELKCNRLVRLNDGDEKPISTFIEQGATIKAEKSVTNELFVLLKSDSEGFRAYGYIDKDDYDGFDVLNKINMEHFNKLINTLDVDDAKHLVREASSLLECGTCPLREYCGNTLKHTIKLCSEIVFDWLMENE